jgi:DNA mismatch repair ATPase MutS
MFYFLADIERRQDAVTTLIQCDSIRKDLHSFLLKRKMDIERRIVRSQYHRIELVDFIHLLQEVCDYYTKRISTHT